MALADVLEASVVRPVFVGLLDFNGAALRGWTGPGALVLSGTGDSDFDTETFLEAESAIEISPINQDRGIGGQLGITFSGGELDDEAAAAQLIADRRQFLGRKAKLALFFLNEAETSVLSDYTILYSGVMTGAETRRQPGEPARISVTCDQDLQKARHAPLRWVDHQVVYSSDTFSTFMTALSRGPLATAETRTFGGVPGTDRAADYGVVPPGSDGTVEDYYNAISGYGTYNVFTGEYGP